MNQLSPAEKREFLKSMDVEWPTRLQNQAAKVLSFEEAAQAQARWPDRAMDTRWALIWKPDESKPSGRRAKARLIIEGFTDPHLLDIESHPPTLSRNSLCAVMDTSCSLGMYSRRSTLETRSSENSHYSSECRLMESQESLVMFGYSC